MIYESYLLLVLNVSDPFSKEQTSPENIRFVRTPSLQYNSMYSYVYVKLATTLQVRGKEPSELGTGECVHCTLTTCVIAQSRFAKQFKGAVCKAILE